MEITIGNIKYPLRASMRAWRKFEKATGVKVSEVDSSDVTMIPELIFYFGC
jgi:L-fucose isomerase-like protein